MWRDSGPDPGGTKGNEAAPGPQTDSELSFLKDQFEQQQVLIAQLKEMLRKTEQTNVTQEKVEEYANTVTRMSARVKKSKTKKAETSESQSVVTSTIISETPASEKIMLLRKQLEENKLKLAQRGKFQKGIEETVNQLQAQFNDSQQLISQTPLNLSLAETKVENYSVYSNPEDLINLLVNRDKKISEQQTRIQKLEGNILDLQENVKEKDSVIDARTKAITLMTESLSKKGKNTLDALDDTKEQMRKMQENFIQMEAEMREQQKQLGHELNRKIEEIQQLKEGRRELENNYNKLAADFEFHKKANVTSTISDSDLCTQLKIELQEKSSEIQHLNETTNKLKAEVDSLNNSLDKYKNDLVIYEKKLADPTISTIGASSSGNLYSQLEALNNRVIELEELNLELQNASSRDSPQRSAKKSKKTQQSAKSTDISDLQKIIDNNKAECKVHCSKMLEYEITINELNAIIEELKTKQSADNKVQDGEELSKLKKQIDEHNKNVIKIKAQHKGKIKELNKKIDELKKDAGSSEEISRLQVENLKLSERIDVLEEEKANLGLDVGITHSAKDSAVKERVIELEIKLLEKTELLESRDESIKTLENHIEFYKTELENLNDRYSKLSQLENAQVVSEITSIHFEEQLDKLEMEKNALIQEKDEIITEKESLLEKIEALTKEKQEISNKLEGYMQENMDLIDKLEKLSAEKVSSAESIEIVEGLTQQEKLELEAYQKSLELNVENIKIMDEIEPNPELNESVNQLTEETSDLLRKIELFTEERREVMDKMEALTVENNHLNMKINEIENNRDILAETYERLQNEKEELEQKLDQETKKVKDVENSLIKEVNKLKMENEVLKQKIDNENVKELINIETVTPQSMANEEKVTELQMLIDEYKSLIDIQKQEIHELKLELLSQKDLFVVNKQLHERVSTIQEQYDAILSENEKLKQTVKESSELVHEKDELELQLVDVKKRIVDFEMKIMHNLDEFENYTSIIEENKSELISKANLISELQSKLIDEQNRVLHYENEQTHLISVITELNSAISHLESENQQHSENNNTMELMSNQLQELKMLLNENIKQIENYEAELQQNSDTISKSNMELKEMNKKLLEMEHELQCKDDEIKKLTKDRDNKDTMIANLQEELRQKDENFHKACDTLKEKCLVLQSQIEQNAGSLDSMKNPLAKIQELEHKNKEQLEKMKKIAANLKKKTTAYQELHEKYVQVEEKWEKEEKEKQQLQETIQNHETKISSLVEQLAKTEMELSTLNDTIALKSKENDDVKCENEELKNIKLQYESQLSSFTLAAEMHSSDESNKLNMTINEKNEIINRLSQQVESLEYNSQTKQNALNAKIQELEMFIETQDEDLTKYKEKVNKLEEGLSAVEERRLSLEQKAVELGAQLEEKSNIYEEASQTGDILEQRLAALMIHDERMERHLQEAVRENQELIERNRFIVEENEKLKHQLSAATEKNLDVSISIEKVSNIENENIRLTEVISDLESDIKRLHEGYKKKLVDKDEEIGNLETELQTQLTQLDNERKNLAMQCEQLYDELKENSENKELLDEQIKNYKRKLEQRQNDIDLHVAQLESLQEQNKTSLVIIEKLNIDLAAKSVLDDEKHRKIEELEKMLLEKDSEVQNYRANQSYELEELKRTNLDLQSRNSELLRQIETSGQTKDVRTDQNLGSEVLKVKNEGIATFTWPQDVSNDPFSFVNEPLNDPQIIQPLSAQKDNLNENVNQELIDKVKTLEFMLYNVEKEKEDILMQCQELTNEVARLIYEKQNSGTDLESQIFSEQETTLTSEERQELKKLEFSQTKEYEDKVDSANSQPVAEDVIESTTAYLCYKLEDPPILPDSQVEPQIVPSHEAAITQGDLQLQNLEFEKVKPCKDITNSSRPVTEDPELCKPTYLYYKFDESAENVGDFVPPVVTVHGLQSSVNVPFVTESEQQSTDAIVNQISLDVFDENDDGWGCGAEEAKLEDAHRQTVENISLNQNRGVHIEEMEERLRVLELEQERHLEEIKQAHVKSGKLIKKLKEFKALNEKLTSDLRRNDFGGLDDAIQDELKSQIASLEKRIKEVSHELEKEKNENSNIRKKIDTLQAANERMEDMKEKQVVEMLVWQRQNMELNAKLEQLKWGEGGFDSPKHEQSELGISTNLNANVLDLEKKVQELTDTVKDLMLDNEELQAMLEEQRTLRLNSEKAKSVEPVLENMKTEAEYFSVVRERDALNENLTCSINEKKDLQEKLNNLLKQGSELEVNLQTLIEEKTVLESRLVQITSINAELNGQVENLQKQNQNISNEEMQRAYNKISHLEHENGELNHRLRDSEMVCQQLKSDHFVLAELQDKLKDAYTEKDNMFKEFQQKVLDIENLSKIVAESNAQKVELEEKLKENKLLADKLQIKELEVVELERKLETTTDERLALTASIQQLNEEWCQRVDQRGTDIAESWKLHLETRETEFLQQEQQLKKEISELEEKCFALVNENNELRKNVDAEIKNEVDRMSALQQQVNDRQRYINDLTHVIQENQMKLEEQQQNLLDCECNNMQLNNQLQEKNKMIEDCETTISTLKVQIQKKEKMIEELTKKLQELELASNQLNENQQLIATLQSELNEGRSKLAEYNETLTSLQQQLQNKDLHIIKITNERQEFEMKQETYQNTIRLLEEEIESLNLKMLEKLNTIEDCNKQVSKLEELNSRIVELETEKEHLIQQFNEELQLKEIEINKAAQLMDDKEKEYVSNMALVTQESENVFIEKAQELDAIKRNYGELQSYYEKLLIAKDSDMENLQCQLTEKARYETEVEELKIQLDLKIQECTNWESKVFEQNVLHSEENKQLSELRMIVEDQVMKIESLKQELFEKSKDYDSLIAELDIRKSSRFEPGPSHEQAIVQDVQSQAAPTKYDSPRNEDHLEPISRAELDLALYMLHQRDVRCEELTVELMQLLEERDTLQLKLSNAIREKEELRSKFVPTSSIPMHDTANTEAPVTPVKNPIIGAAGTEVVTEVTEGDPLANKLFELKSVGYGRDKTLLDEQQQRRLQQLLLMQQHQNVAAMLPPEAAAKLVQEASYTLSRDVQSPSKVLLNWLWGKSTPKVNEI